MSRKTWTRRDVLRAGASALALPAFLPARLLGRPGDPGASDQVRVGIIGLGGRAKGVVDDIRGLPGLRIAAVCDCFQPRIGSFMDEKGKDSGWKGYEDFRRMIDEEKLDAVMVETTTQARAWIVVQAMQMGCDVYIEKPMALSIAEGRYLVRAARRYGRVAQVGTQQRSTPLNNWASDLVKEGAIGRVHTVVAPNFAGPKQWAPKPAAPMPEGASEGWWDVWTNQAVMRPYHPDLHYGWARWWDYDGGGECFGVTGWGAHAYDQVNRGLGTDETGPVAIWLEEPVRVSNTGKFTTPRGQDDTGADYHHMAQPVIGPRAKVTIRFASGVDVKCHLDGDVGPGLGAIFVGTGGRIEINRNKVAADPPEVFERARAARPAVARGTPLHVANWIDCVKTRERPSADIEYGQRSSTLCYLVNIVRDVGRVGEVLHWDPEEERFTDCEEGNRLLNRGRREGWELPDLV